MGYGDNVHGVKRDDFTPWPNSMVKVMIQKFKPLDMIYKN